MTRAIALQVCIALLSGPTSYAFQTNPSIVSASRQQQQQQHYSQQRDMALGVLKTPNDSPSATKLGYTKEVDAAGIDVDIDIDVAAATSTTTSTQAKEQDNTKNNKNQSRKSSRDSRKKYHLKEEECRIDEACDSESNEYAQLVDEMAESLDIQRENTRMDSLDAYTLVSCLTATTSFGTVCGLTMGDSAFMHALSVFVSSLSSLTGMYSTVVFSLCSAYGRTSIGMGRDMQYDTFMADTGLIRYKGFQAFVWSLGLFLVEMALVTTEHMDPTIRIPFLLSFSGLAIYTFKDWKAVMDAASKIFAP